jgi:tetratricopeptide (TPR) repeat protein
MIYKGKLNFAAQKYKRFSLVLISNLVLMNLGMTCAEAAGRYPSSKTLRSTARIYMAYGEYKKAQPFVERALILARRDKTADSELAMCLIDAATLYNYQGKPADAEKMCKLGLELQEKVLYKNHPYIAYTLRILSSIYQQQGNYNEAQSALNRAMAIMLDSHSADDKEMAPFMVDIAGVLIAKGELKEAENYYQKSIALINDSYGPDHPYTATVLSNMAEMYIILERYEQAEELIDRALATQEDTYGPDHHLIAPTWLTKAKLCQARADYAQAENLIDRALVAVEKTGNKAALAKIKRTVEQIYTGSQVVASVLPASANKTKPQISENTIK